MTPLKKPLGFLIASCLLLLPIMAVGCGDGHPKRVPVAGRVLIDGKPLAAGYIQVYPAHDRGATGIIGPDGRFKLTTYEKDDGCVLGKHRVTIVGSEPKSTNVLRWLAPKKYGELNHSGLEMEVTGPTDNVEFKLTWDGGKPFTEDLLRGGHEGTLGRKR